MKFKEMMICNLMIIMGECLTIGFMIAKRVFDAWFWMAVAGTIALSALTIYNICILKENEK